MAGVIFAYFDEERGWLTSCPKWLGQLAQSTFTPEANFRYASLWFILIVIIMTIASCCKCPLAARSRLSGEIPEQHLLKD
ncbi:MAG: hypothetical protein R2880_09770 [Deinococcales bacterium]